MSDDTTYETINEQTHRQGKSNFTEVSLRRATNSKGSHEFVQLSKGFIAQDGGKRYKQSFTITDPETLAFVMSGLKERENSLKPKQIAPATPAPTTAATKAAPAQGRRIANPFL